MKQRQIIPLTLEAPTIATGTTTDIEFGPVPVGEIWFVEQVAYENNTGSRGSFKLGIRKPVYDHWYVEKTSPSAGILYQHHMETYITEGEKLVVRQETTVALDVLEAYLTGRRYYERALREGDILAP